MPSMLVPLFPDIYNSDCTEERERGPFLFLVLFFWPETVLGRYLSSYGHGIILSFLAPLLAEKTALVWTDTIVLPFYTLSPNQSNNLPKSCFSRSTDGVTLDHPVESQTWKPIHNMKYFNLQFTPPPPINIRLESDLRTLYLALTLMWENSPVA